MNFFKFILVLFLATLVVGGAYLMTMLSPGKVVDAPITYIDPTIESAEILKESELLESEFEKFAQIGTPNTEMIEKLRRAIRLQEVYIEKSRSVSSDNAPMNRLTRLRTRLQNLEAEPMAKIVKELIENANRTEEAGDITATENFLRQAYDMSDKINRNYPLSRFKNITITVDLDKRIKNLYIGPLYKKSLEAEEMAKKCLEKFKWSDAATHFEEAIKISEEISAKYPASGYNDYLRIQRLRSEIDSLRSNPFKEKLDNALESAKQSDDKGEYAEASEAYYAAASIQKDINSLFPRSIHSSDEKFVEYSNLANIAKSKISSAELIALDKDFMKAIHKADIVSASDISTSIATKFEQFVSDFPKNTQISSEDVLRVRYLNFILKQILEIRALTLQNLADFGDKSGAKMLKTEVSQKLFDIVMQENPSRDSSSLDKPVESVTYEEAKLFCQRLTWILGKKVSLPTEEQYKLAVGNLRYADIDAISWNGSNSGGKIQKCATKKANDKGFFDLLGNVGEFTDLVYADTVLVLGGGAQTSADAIAVLPSVRMDKNQRNRMVGFRIVIY